MNMNTAQIHSRGVLVEGRGGNHGYGATSPRKTATAAAPAANGSKHLARPEDVIPLEDDDLKDF